MLVRRSSAPIRAVGFRPQATKIEKVQANLYALLFECRHRDAFQRGIRASSSPIPGSSSCDTIAKVGAVGLADKTVQPAHHHDINTHTHGDHNRN